ncbi:L,D-transpeptidase/peptidoglycan binding protein [Kineothrix sp. MSJ-39]|uniref:L,D-transpeptidase family protein n=1 Tax=Kineothrix sp. MSJ-39 TaxID=2841533 RepID=UPI001C10BD82|nr:L,D-transpeptidase family protein [Kineothrix sp. MSJ-39]MBU5430737.1 L,D-transpeptidase/peptidoglycan binding protein [Kineothrix sp. MSJ-39]
MQNKKKKRKKKNKRIVLWSSLGVLLVFLLGLLTAGSVYCSSHFSKGTVINEIDASGLTMAELENRMREYVLTVRERTGEGSYITETITGDQIGVTVSNTDELEGILKKQNILKAISSYIKGEQQVYTVENLYAYVDSALMTAILKLQGFQDSFVTEPVDAHISDYDPQSGYQIVPEVRGNVLNQTKTIQTVKEAVDALLPETDLEEAGCYEEPSVYADDTKLTERLAQMKQYTDLRIVYHFGQQEEVIDGSVLSQWLLVDEETNKVSVSEEKIDDFVVMLRKKYDTIFRSREFQTSYGKTITIEGGDYGWWMNYSQEQEELKEMIKNGESGERIPVYYQTAAVYGSQDYGNTYIEINLTAQHLFLYVDGEKKMESEFVSGNASRGFDTPAGIYGITYKEQDAMLVGENYETPVSYWMPFNGNIGLHDAIWRDSFGADIYKKSGSHGCVNMPYLKAKELYGEIAKGTPVICYYLDGTASEETIGQSDAEKAQAVVDSIAKIGTVTKDSKKKIERARQLYNDASAAQREYVTNYEVLTAAEDMYQSLKK